MRGHNRTHIGNREQDTQNMIIVRYGYDQNQYDNTHYGVLEDSGDSLVVRGNHTNNIQYDGHDKDPAQKLVF
jgi:hypothetical protein